MADAPLTVMLFAGLAEQVGQREVTLAWAGGTAADLLAALEQQHPQAAALLARSAVAVGERYCRGDDLVAAGGDVAVIPPVSGG